MPNWCSNEVIIEGDPETLDLIQSVSAYGDLPFSMEAFKPTPPLLLERSGISKDGNAIGEAILGNTDYQYDNWYEWRIANWGTKWDIGELQIDRTRRGIYLNYETAWAPNVNFWTYFSTLYPTLKITHHFVEEGMCFIGQVLYKDGDADEISRNISDEDYIKAGASLDSDGYITEDSRYDLWDLFPLSSVKEN